jgi:hypothetical protein
MNNSYSNKKDSVNELDNEKLKESETLKDSYCDKIVKNMEEYRNICESKKQ